MLDLVGSYPIEIAMTFGRDSVNLRIPFLFAPVDRSVPPQLRSAGAKALQRSSSASRENDARNSMIQRSPTDSPTRRQSLYAFRFKLGKESDGTGASFARNNSSQESFQESFMGEESCLRDSKSATDEIAAS